MDTYIVCGKETKVPQTPKPHQQVTQPQEERAHIPSVKVAFIALQGKKIIDRWVGDAQTTHSLQDKYSHCLCNTQLYVFNK